MTWLDNLKNGTVPVRPVVGAQPDATSARRYTPPAPINRAALPPNLAQIGDNTLANRVRMRGVESDRAENAMLASPLGAGVAVAKGLNEPLNAVQSAVGAYGHTKDLVDNLKGGRYGMAALSAGGLGLDAAGLIPGARALGKLGKAGKVAEGVSTAFHEVEPGAFHSALSDFAKARPDEQGFITWRSPEQMQAEGMKTYLSPDQKTGYAIHPESGDIRNVFNHGVAGGGAHALADAVANKGGRILDAFDTGLGNFYRDFGFKEHGRGQWNNDYRPDNWNEAKYGTPDVVEMHHPQSGTASSDDLLAQYNANRAQRKAQTTPTPPNGSFMGPSGRSLTGLGARPMAANRVGAINPTGGDVSQWAQQAVPQTNLPRFVSTRMPQSKVDDMEDALYKTFTGPDHERWTTSGGNGAWYDTQRTKQKAVDALGPEGPAGFQRMMQMMGAVTARSDPQNNLRRASYYYGLEKAGLLDPEQLAAGAYKASPAGTPPELSNLPEGMGHFAQGAHHSGLQKLLLNGDIDPIGNPKPAGFVQNLMGNGLPYTHDTRMAMGAQLANPQLEQLGALDRIVAKNGSVTFSPSNAGYAPSERAAQRAAEHFQSRGLIEPPQGVHPTSYWQAKIWDALGNVLPGASPNQGLFDDIFDHKISEASSLWGVSPSEANQRVWQGHPFDTPLNAPLAPRNLWSSTPGR